MHFFFFKKKKKKKAQKKATATTNKQNKNSLVSFDEVKTIIKTHQGQKWQLHPRRYNRNDSYHLLGRGSCAKLFRHTHLRHHPHTKYGIGRQLGHICQRQQTTSTKDNRPHPPKTAEHIRQRQQTTSSKDNRLRPPKTADHIRQRQQTTSAKDSSRPHPPETVDYIRQRQQTTSA